jgi:hypothetical protein
LQCEVGGREEGIAGNRIKTRAGSHEEISQAVFVPKPIYVAPAQRRDHTEQPVTPIRNIDTAAENIHSAAAREGIIFVGKLDTPNDGGGIGSLGTANP